MTAPDILTPLQKDWMQLLFEEKWFRRHFYLTGGTALSAFYYRHRYSEDLDFFSHEIDLTPVAGLMETIGKKLRLKVETTQTTPTLRRYSIGGDLKIDIASDTSFRVGAPQLIENIMVDNLKNIAVNKVVCILGRLEVKDYVDLFWILRSEKYDLFELFELGQNKDGGLEPFIWSSLIADVDRFQFLPRMIQPLTLGDLQQFYHTLRDNILDRIKPA